MDKTISLFNDFNETDPCEECNAPCCKYLLIPYKTPSTWMDMDFIKYLLNFPDVKLTVSKKGTWNIMIEQNCIHLDEQNLKCKVHKTADQPKTCVYYNPYQCNYKMNLSSNKASSIYILTRDNFQNWLHELKFDENGLIVDGPSFEKSVTILNGSE